MRRAIGADLVVLLVVLAVGSLFASFVVGFLDGRYNERRDISPTTTWAPRLPTTTWAPLTTTTWAPLTTTTLRNYSDGGNNNDGISDWMDSDADNDGISDWMDSDCDNDGISNWMDSDDGGC